MPLTASLSLTPGLDELTDFVSQYSRLFVLTGAGCSTESGIPDYRDSDGGWKHRPPVQYQDFLRSERTRQRYWARSLLGWGRIAQAEPNAAHHALAGLEVAGFIHQLVTQNVDGLHQRAGSRRVIDLHGRLDAVDCLDCRHRSPRAEFQRRLIEQNPSFTALVATGAPDGDALLEDMDYGGFQVPSCSRCRSVVKPTVVFFGEAVPRPRVDRALARLAQADALLVVGSSLMVYSGYRFCRAAAEQGKPIAAVNLGRTRADGELKLKISAHCGEILPGLLQRLL